MDKIKMWKALTSEIRRAFAVRGRSAGFTIIELLIAFTILAVVAGTLFQVFITADMNNSRAEEADFANIAATTAVELFKASPEKSESFIKCFDSRWNEIGNILYSPDNGLINITGQDAAMFARGERYPPEASYVLEAVVSKGVIAGIDEGGRREAAAEAVLDSRENHRLLISDATGDFEVQLDGIPLNVQHEITGGQLPINVVFNNVGTLPKKVSVINKTDTPVNLSVYNIPGGAGNDEGARNALIQVTSAEGSCGVAFYSDNRHIGERHMYYVNVVVCKLTGASQDGVGFVELVNYGGSKYVVS